MSKATYKNRNSLACLNNAGSYSAISYCSHILASSYAAVKVSRSYRYLNFKVKVHNDNESSSRPLKNLPIKKPRLDFLILTFSAKKFSLATLVSNEAKKLSLPSPRRRKNQ